MGVAPAFLVSIYVVRNTVNTHKGNRHHDPLISTYFTSRSFKVSATCVGCTLYVIQPV